MKANKVFEVRFESVKEDIQGVKIFHILAGHVKEAIHKAEVLLKKRAKEFQGRQFIKSVELIAEIDA